MHAIYIRDDGQTAAYMQYSNRLLVNYRSTVPVDLLYSLILDICVNSTFKNSLIQLDSARAHKFGENSGDKNTMPIVSAYIIIIDQHLPIN